MGQIILSQAGQALGSAVLPGGLNLLGADVSGAALGGALGGLAGRAVDSAFASDVHGPRMSALHLMESREGAGLPLVYGRARVGGQVIWAARFKEKRRERSAGKGGPKLNDYSYSVSFAVAIAQGPVTRVGRVWANGEVLAVADFNHRFYRGDESQLPDPLIEAVEGAGNAPAYRGTAYIIFEDLPLDRFGNRLPQLSFEVFRALEGDGSLRRVVKGLNIIPATGEFAYATDIVRERRFPGIETPLNMNNPAGAANFTQSLAQAQDDFPQLQRVALTVAWFGDDLRAGSCRIRPGVETRERTSVPFAWEVAGLLRAQARLVSQSNGKANYGGTPSDKSVLQAIAQMKADGLEVTLSPFLLMDIPAGNGLPDPYGAEEQGAFPWRGRITSLPDRAASVRTAIEAFVATDGAFGYRHFILHHARLAAEAGGVDAFLIGSEMVALTRLRDETGAFPFVEALTEIAAEARDILGPDTLISYAADWTEYGAYVPQDGSGDVLFPLDPLWASPDLDFVGVDWYPPLSDWRDGSDHLDALAGFEGASDAAYLAANLQGGEGYDWYYASAEARAAQDRTPIRDEAHDEPWVFRQKDIGNWWGQSHYPRVGGIRSSTPTSWTPGLKPVRLMEIGFPAVDRGTNAPNIFYDPKSSESALPHFSDGARNDVLQRRALEVSLTYWQAQPFVDVAFAWAWDARPWPDFPVREEVWSDGPNWSLGHWLNGRSGLVPLTSVIEDLSALSGVEMEAGAIDGLVEGFVVPAPSTLRSVLEPLHALQRFSCRESEAGLSLQPASRGVALTVAAGEIAGDGPSMTHVLLDKRPGHLTLTHISADDAYAPAVAHARIPEGDARYRIETSLPLLMSEAEATRVAGDLLKAAVESERASLTLPPHFVALELGDRISVETLPGEWVIDDITDDGIARRLELSRPVEAVSVLAGSVPDRGTAALVPAAPELILIDAPALPGKSANGPLVAATGSPWVGPIAVEAGRSLNGLKTRARVPAPASIGRLIAPLAAGPVHRWDTSSKIELELFGGEVSSAEPKSVLAGANTLLVQSEEGWEALSFQRADLQEDGSWRLSGLLRGLYGSAPAEAEQGALVVLIDDALEPPAFKRDEVGIEMHWRAGESDPQVFRHQDRAGLPWPVAQLWAKQTAGGMQVSWLACAPDIPDSWDLPDPTGSRLFEVVGLLEGGEVVNFRTPKSAVTLEVSVDEVRVAEVAADGRLGRWVSIGAGAL
ncbi:baseplate multidomain protein megatron [Henriciella marina]|uniref:Glycoside hydrolase/phage tail family protein n=1 Tax=Henriciella marina TaxID=453851 RepID=A0ABT4LUH7_9PROT|nr:glycoside hydrolase/phage tail family protein [Henriciella marina]MCZ4297995.1 glycoside hydrolase/phage tail family protein [Henriciella marina]